MTEALKPVLHRSVRSVIKTHGAACEALCRIAMGTRTDWTLKDWRAKLAELDACNESVGDWLALHD